jgi:hypothetical protein
MDMATRIAWGHIGIPYSALILLGRLAVNFRKSTLSLGYSLLSEGKPAWCRTSKSESGWLSRGILNLVV